MYTILDDDNTADNIQPMAISTDVSATVIDRDNIAWAGCQCRAILIGYDGFIPQFLSDGTQVQNVVITTADAAGHIEMFLAANNAITPSGTKWRLFITPLASSPASVFDVIVIGASLDLSVMIKNSITPPRFVLNGTNYGYDDVEVIVPTAGSVGVSYSNTTTGKLRWWNGTGFVDTLSGLPNSLTIAGTMSAGNFRTTANNSAGILTPVQGTTQGWNIKTGFGETDFINTHPAGVGGGFYFYNVQAGAFVDGTTPVAMSLDGSNQLTICSGKLRLLDTSLGLQTSGSANINSDGNSIRVSSTTTGAVYLGWDSVCPTIWGNGVGAEVARINQVGDLTCRSVSTSATSPRFTAVGNFGWDANTTYIDSFGATATRGQLYVRLGGANAAGLLNAMILNSNGDATFFGNIAAATKSFRITHPLDDTKDLIHGSLEGPEYGVYYRGESATGSDGSVVVTLPDYFEALVLPDQRTILLTQIVDDDEQPVFDGLVASRIRDGQFTVYSANNQGTKFCWQVTAVRADIPPLQVVQDKPPVPDPPEPEPPLEREPDDAD